MAHRHQKTLLALLALVLLGLSLVREGVPVAEANVGLIDFIVDSGDSDTSLEITWQTESETGMVGFRLKRSTAPSVDQATLVATVGSSGSATGGGDYQVMDSGLTTGQTYYYWLFEIKTDTSEGLISDYKAGIPGGQALPTNTPTHTPTTLPTATATQVSVQPPPPATPTATQTDTPKQTGTPPSSTATSIPTNTPTTFQGVSPTPIPTSPGAEAAATSTPRPQSNNSPTGATSTPLPTSSPSSLAQTQSTNTPVVAVPTTIVEGATPRNVAPTTEVRSDATPVTAPEAGTPATDQALQVPPTPTQVLDAASTAGSAEPAPGETVEPTPQAIAQEAAPGAAAPAERLARPTATPRPVTSAKTDSDSGSLLLIFGGASLCGAVVLALAVLVVWRRR